MSEEQLELWYMYLTCPSKTNKQTKTTTNKGVGCHRYPDALQINQHYPSFYLTWNNVLTMRTQNNHLSIFFLTSLLWFVCWLLNVPAICKCISGIDLLRQFYMLLNWDRSCRSNFPSHPVTVYWHQANQSQHWPYTARRLAGSHWSANF